MLVLVVSTLISGAFGHGWMTKPVARASLGCTKSNNSWYYCESHQATMDACDNLPCGQCHLPRVGNDRGSTCTAGDYPGHATPKEPYCNPNQMVGTSFLETRGKVQTRLTAGETVDVAWSVSAPHGGQYQYRLCLDGTDTEECFNKTPLLFADGSRWHRLESPCADCSWTPDQFGREQFIKPDRIVIPKDVQCEHCTLGWRWDTTFYESTIFTSCSDVSISAAPAPSPSPTPAPEPIEDNCVDEPLQRCGGKMKCCKQDMMCHTVNRWISQCEPVLSERTLATVLDHRERNQAFLK